MDAKDPAQSRIPRKSLLGKDQRDLMATAQAFSNICQSKASANTKLTDKCSSAGARPRRGHQGHARLRGRG
jgi:hypothetical protein